MKVKDTVDTVEKAANRFKATRRDFIYISVILALILGGIGWSFLVKEYNNKVSETTIIYKNDKFLKDSLPTIFNNGFLELKEFVKNGIDKSRNETKIEIRNSEHRTNIKLKAILQFLPVTEKEDYLLNKIIEVEEESYIPEIKEGEVNTLEFNNNDVIYTVKEDENYGYNFFDKNGIFFSGLTNDTSLAKSKSKKKQGFIKRIFAKNE